MGRSKLQAATAKALRDTLGNAVSIRENYRPEWLMTGESQRLELDFYIADLKLAIEVQGEQHYKFIGFYHKTTDGFNDLLKRDEAKRVICRSRNLSFVEISSNDDLERLIDGLKARATATANSIFSRQAEIRAYCAETASPLPTEPKRLRKARRRLADYRAFIATLTKVKPGHLEYLAGCEARVVKFQQQYESGIAGIRELEKQRAAHVR